MMKKMAEISMNALKKLNLSILIYPEGTRNVDTIDGQKLKTGIAQIALHSGVKVVPVACENTADAFPGNMPIPEKDKTISYTFGTPIDFSKYDPGEKFELFSYESQKTHKEIFSEITEIIIKNIYQLMSDKGH